jgi:hypothetical protein
LASYSVPPSDIDQIAVPDFLGRMRCSEALCDHE